MEDDIVGSKIDYLTTIKTLQWFPCLGLWAV